VVSVREVAHGDVDAIVDLAARKREQYAEYNPVFHNPAADAREQHAAFIADLIDNDNAISLVYDDDGVVRGVAIGTLIDAPPIYDLGGKTCMIDDFMVDEPDAWAPVGRALLDAVAEVARTRGAAQIVVVCGPDDTPKRATLAAGGCTVVTEWFTKPL